MIRRWARKWAMRQAEQRVAAGEPCLGVRPLGDQIVHEPSDDCVCGPTTKPIERPDGSIGWLHIHHPLDGRRT